jgi:hypothetical protein
VITMNRYASFGVIVLITLGTIMSISTTKTQSAEAIIAILIGEYAPVTVSGDNIYVAWWTNKTGNDEVMFRASTDGGKTFGDKINLSNTPNSDSVNVQLAEDEGKVAVSWWERNQTSNEPVMRISTDAGKTFGNTIHLSTNGKIG